MLMQEELSRLFLIFVVDMIMALFFLFLGFSTLLRKRSRLNTTFSLFFISIALGLLINAAYAIINGILRSEPIALFLNYVSGFLIFFGPIFMLATNFMLLHSGVSYGLESELKLIIGYAVVLGSMAIFYFLGGIRFNESTNWSPDWSLPYFIYIVIVVSGFAVIPTLYTTAKILRTMVDKLLRRRWKRLMVSLIGLFTYLYLAFLSNFLNTSNLNSILSIYALSVPLWVWLIYKGVKKES